MLALPKKPRLASDSEGEEEEKGDGKKQTSLFSFFKRKPKKTEDCKSAEPESVSLSVSVLKAQADAEVSSEYRRMLPFLWGIRLWWQIITLVIPFQAQRPKLARRLKAGREPGSLVWAKMQGWSLKLAKLPLEKLDCPNLP